MISDTLKANHLNGEAQTMQSDTLCIIPPGKRKIWDRDAAHGPAPARDAYTGTLNRKARAYAEASGYDWVILSAKHGFLMPADTVPGNYDTAFGAANADIISSEELARQWREKELHTYGRIEVLGGKKFRPIIGALAGTSAVYFPLENSRGIGDMLHLLDGWTARITTEADVE
ncbi:hypothetical protein P4H65_26590 [Paenibacillus chitinolyticus]|uniref:DUF6884 domain-containing protein n=1 Tax=Paenibacillus chitinolyticus TaxID=79263 RepID=UPI002DBBA403|nr:DUF6884 domain-containing protein [Paenibacillus chitinolyticus]MEC0249352.1 hypothetical protein [Paenibacillus chitinolyticus]